MKKILIIDDEPHILLMLKKMLERSGYEIELATNGVEGIELFKKIKPDLVITDIIMPETEGIETIMELQRDFPDVKIIAISGGGHNIAENYLYLAKSLGVQRTFAKPIERDELLKAVSELLD